MEILRKNTMPDGTKIQLESWKEYNDNIIGAYPLAQRSNGKSVKAGSLFRVTIPTKIFANYSAEMLKEDYEALISGDKTLADLRTHFWNGEEDAYVLGLETNWKPERRD